MSDRFRTAAAVLLLAAAAALCLIPAVSTDRNNRGVYHSGRRGDMPLTAISTEANGPVRVNDADAEELTELYGVGETLAWLIVSERQENGPYFYAEDLEAVKGIGPATLARFRDMIDMTTDERGK